MAVINTGGAETSPRLFDHIISVTMAWNINKSTKTQNGNRKSKRHQHNYATTGSAHSGPWTLQTCRFQSVQEPFLYFYPSRSKSDRIFKQFSPLRASRQLRNFAMKSKKMEVSRRLLAGKKDRATESKPLLLLCDLWILDSTPWKHHNPHLVFRSSSSSCDAWWKHTHPPQLNCDALTAR